MPKEAISLGAVDDVVPIQNIPQAIVNFLQKQAMMLLVPVAILRKIGKEFSEEGVDLEVVLGALCAYLYIGAYFSFLYDVMARISKSPFFAQPGRTAS